MNTNVACWILRIIAGNLGTAPLAGLGVPVNGAGAAVFSPHAASQPARIESRAPSRFTLTFDHPSFGEKLAVLQINSGGSGSLFEGLMGGIVVDPEVTPVGDGISNMLKIHLT